MCKRFFSIYFLLILSFFTPSLGVQQSDCPQSVPHRFPCASATTWNLYPFTLHEFGTQKVIFDSKSCTNNQSTQRLYGKLVEFDKRNKITEPLVLYSLSYMSFLGIGCEKNNDTALDYIMRAIQLTGPQKPGVELSKDHIKDFCTISNLFGILQIRKAKTFTDCNSSILGVGVLYAAVVNQSLEASYNLGLIYYFGLGQQKADYPFAYHYFSFAAKENKNAAYFCAHMLYKGLGINKNYHGALLLQRSHHDLLEQSDVQYERGCIYLKGGFGINCDYQKAREYFLKSAAQGNDKAMYRLAYMTDKGLGVSQNLFDTCKWLEKAMLKKNIKALLQIKKIAKDSKFIPAMYVGAENGDLDCVQMLKEESLKESSLAKLYYGLVLFSGVENVVSSKPLEGLQLIKQAAESGNTYAMYWYGNICFCGNKIIPKNEKEGLIWLEKASNCGSKEASEILARYYVLEESWTSKPRDVNKAFDYFVKASTQ
jgi:hypothetical protein